MKKFIGALMTVAILVLAVRDGPRLWMFHKH